MTPVLAPAIIELGGIPAHPLVVHAAVVLVPLLAIAVIVLMLLRADLRRKWGMPLAVVALGLLVVTQVAVFTGEQLANATGEADEPEIHEHGEHGETLRLVLAAMTVLLGATAWADRRAAPAAVAASSAAGATSDRRSLLTTGLRAATGVAALGVIATAVNTGHSGAWAVWRETAAEINGGGGGEGGDRRGCRLHRRLHRPGSSPGHELLSRRPVW